MTVEKATYVDDLNVDVTISYTCAKGEAKGVLVSVSQTDPALDEENGVGDAGGSNSTEKITCKGKPQSVTLRVNNSGQDEFAHPGAGDVRATIYGSNGVIKDNKKNLTW
ncbi:hypothetical protein OG203_37220 [Nocardia sp. NBC_01499]|uniref:hypothetical protein n=1 Tax=Nocardia sp. NBC_01499 TaxID=2903597 RepID=UPI003870C719